MSSIFRDYVGLAGSTLCTSFECRDILQYWSKALLHITQVKSRKPRCTKLLWLSKAVLFLNGLLQILQTIASLGLWTKSKCCINRFFRKKPFLQRLHLNDFTLRWTHWTWHFNANLDAKHFSHISQTCGLIPRCTELLCLIYSPIALNLTLHASQ